MQEITRLEADELVIRFGVAGQRFVQDKNAMRFDFRLSNGLFLIVMYNHNSKEMAYFVLAQKIAEFIQS